MDARWQSPPTTNCAPPNAPAFAAPLSGAWAMKILPYGPSGMPSIRTIRSGPVWKIARPATTSLSRARETSGESPTLPKAGSVRLNTTPPPTPSRDETYDSYPLSWRIDQLGAAPHKIALTFDDGPDPRWTPEILSILEEKHAPATFFVTGVSADSSPDLLKREYAGGNEIGNHTYTHPDFSQISRAQLQIELNLTQRLLESTLGIRTLLFRPPYGIDHQPESASEVAQLPIPQSMGYLIIGARIDPDDWGEPTGGPPAPANVLVQRIMDQVAGKVAGAVGGNIVLMHDGGGDRSHTVAALPVVIDKLRAKGYQLVTVSDLLGQTRAQVMPPLGREEWLFARADAFIFDLFHYVRLADCVYFYCRNSAGQRARPDYRSAGAGGKIAPGARGASRISAAGQRSDSRVQRGSGDRRYRPLGVWPLIILFSK